MIVDRLYYNLSMLSVHGTLLFLVVLFPLWMWRDGLTRRSFGEKVLFSILTQTAFLVNLVLLLGFFGVANRFTLLLGLVLEYIVVRWTVSDRQFLVRLRGNGQMLRLVLQGQVPLFDLKQQLKGQNYLLRQRLKHRLFPRKPTASEVANGVFLAAVLLYNALFLTHQVRIFHSYQFSDLPVHMSWIFGLQQGKLFVNGIYPFALHAMCFTVGTIFPIEMREVILYFGAFQTLLTIFTLFMFSKQLFRWRYSPHLVLLLWSILLNQGRYGSSLPQEGGVFALFAAAYFLLKLLHTDVPPYRIQTDSRWRAFFRINQYLSRLYLRFDFFMLMLAVALIIAFHFYTAIAAILLCVSLVLTHLPRFLKKQYFVPIVAAALLGVVIAVLPFGASYATGTPFQESMEWAMSVIKGESWEGTGSGYLESLEQQPQGSAAETQNAATAAPAPQGEGGNVSVFHRGLSPRETVRAIVHSITYFTTSAMLSDRIMLLVLLSALLAAGLGLPMRFTKRYGAYSAGLYGVLLYAVILCFMGAANDLGLTIILNSDRSAGFLEPACFVIIAMGMDVVFTLLSDLRRQSRAYRAVLSVLSLLLCAALGVGLVQQGFYHNYFDVNLAYYNEPDYLIKRIRAERRPFTYTIVSPTDEFYAIVDKAYHYEISELMRDVDTRGKVVKIPTPYVYLFIEKYTLQDYFYGQQFVSPDYAKMDFQYRASTKDYYYQRNIIESKAYYWAKAMQDLYPERMRLYYEDDIYVAYVLVQDENTPLDLNIDYLSELEGSE